MNATAAAQPNSTSIQPLASEIAPLNLEDVDDEDDLGIMDDLHNGEDADDDEVLDLSGKDLEKLSRATDKDQLNTTTLILDDNKLQRLDYLHSYECLEKLSARNNSLLRMFQVSKLGHLKILNLAGNKIVTMEGLRELKLLTWLSLASNSLKGIENLNQNVRLEHLDLSDNNISQLVDISYLKNLRTLLLHKNRLTTLHSANRFLPSSTLSALTINDNAIADLTEVSHVSSLTNLEQLTLTNNPAIEQPEDESLQFDYRPYVINWCLSLRVLDGMVVTAKESLKAEWMYAQSKGRHFVPGKHTELLAYLLETCPLHPGEDWQEDEKLDIILSKVVEHQQSLRSDSVSVQGTPRHTLPRSTATPTSAQQRSIDSNTTPRRSASVKPSPSSNQPQQHPHSADSITSRYRRSQSNTPSLPRRGFHLRSSSGASPSPVRRVSNNRQSVQPAAYRVSLPPTLYASEDETSNDINGNHPSMTQSLMAWPSNQQNENQSNNPNKAGGDSMTKSTIVSPRKKAGNSKIPGTKTRPSRSLGSANSSKMSASMTAGDLRSYNNQNQTAEDSDCSNNEKLRVFKNSGKPREIWNRPSSLFSNENTSGEDNNGRMSVHEFSDSDIESSRLLPPSSNKLNPVPESLNSPDLPSSQRPPAKQRDDPMMYHSLTASTIVASSNTVVTKSKPAPTKVIPKAMSTSYHASTSADKKRSSSNSRLSSTSTPPAQRAATAANNSSPSNLHQPNNNKNLPKNQQPKRKVSAPSNKQIQELKKEPISQLKRPSSSETSNNSNISSPRTKRSQQRKSSSLLTKRKQTSGNIDFEDDSESSNDSGLAATGRKTSEEKRLPSSLHSNVVMTKSINVTSSYTPDKYTDNNSKMMSKSVMGTLKSPRPNSAPSSSNNAKGAATRPTPAGSKSAGINRRSNVNGKNNYDSDITENAATVLQKHWRGQVTRNKDEKVSELKEEIKSLRMDEHVKYLSRELQGAKAALDQERKLRSLQMDAIKVLWTEVQLMDATKGGMESNRSRPSGNPGSKISSRSSEHSIAKLMETLEATASSMPPSLTSEDLAGLQDQQLQQPQSLPLQRTNSGEVVEAESIRKLTETCTGLQAQVERLQTSLNSVLKFVADQQKEDSETSRRFSSSTDTTTTTTNSFQFREGEPVRPNPPQSLPPSLFNSVLVEGNELEDSSSTFKSLQPSQSFSSSMVQTDISAVVTPQSEESKAKFFLHKPDENEENEVVRAEDFEEENESNKSESPVTPTLATISQSSHLETDSLDSEHQNIQVSKNN